VRRGAGWSGRGGGQARPGSVLAAARSWLLLAKAASARWSSPTASQRSSVVAVVDNARMPALPSVAGPRPPSGVPPSGCVGRRLGWGCPAVRCLVNWLPRPASGRPAVWCPPVPGSSRPLSGVLPSTRSGQSRPASGGEVGDQVGAAGQRPPIRCPAVRCRLSARLVSGRPGCPGSASSWSARRWLRGPRRRGGHLHGCNGSTSSWSAPSPTGWVDGSNRPGRGRRCAGRGIGWEVGRGRAGWCSVRAATALDH
jgi:hypothetical protein